MVLQHFLPTKVKKGFFIQRYDLWLEGESSENVKSLEGSPVQYHLIDNPTCHFCNLELETIWHNILRCPTYTVCRVRFLMNTTHNKIMRYCVWVCMAPYCFVDWSINKGTTSLCNEFAYSSLMMTRPQLNCVKSPLNHERSTLQNLLFIYKH